jgi:hypothetical protein
LHNYVQGIPSNLISGSTQITGSNSLTLKLQTPISGGFYTLSFPASQYNLGINRVSGTYVSSIYLSSTDATLSLKLSQSGSIKFTPIWGSLDGTTSFHTGSVITAYGATIGSSIESKKYIVSVSGLKSDIEDTEVNVLRVNIFDKTLPHVFLVKTPVESPGVVVRNAYYSIRDVNTNNVVIPFDTIKGSTKLSADSKGMYFSLDASNLVVGRTYVVDVLISTYNNDQVYRSASPSFRVVSST